MKQLASACIVCTFAALLAACGGGMAEKPVIVGPVPADPRAAHLYLEGVKWLAHAGRANEQHAIENFEAALGVDPTTDIHDQFHRPYRVVPAGEVVADLLCRRVS